MVIDLIAEDARWAALTPEPLANGALAAVLSRLGMAGAAAEVSLLLCDDARIAGLNAEFRGKPAPTNVLSWPAHDLAPGEPGGTPVRPPADPDGTVALGDVALAYDTCAREAAETGKPMADHVTHLMVHGLLHLLGYDHMSDLDATVMEALEVEILGSMGLADPYSDETGA